MPGDEETATARYIARMCPLITAVAITLSSFRGSLHVTGKPAQAGNL
jgi:hypothetical protein